MKFFSVSQKLLLFFNGRPVCIKVEKVLSLCIKLNERRFVDKSYGKFYSLSFFIALVIALVKSCGSFQKCLFDVL